MLDSIVQPIRTSQNNIPPLEAPFYIQNLYSRNLNTQKQILTSSTFNYTFNGYLFIIILFKPDLLIFLLVPPGSKQYFNLNASHPTIYITYIAVKNREKKRIMEKKDEEGNCIFQGQVC